MPQERKLTDEDVQLIMRAALSGDRQAAVKLLQNYTDDMYYAARLYLKDHGTAKKAVQDAFNTAYVRLHSAASEPSFERWLHDIVRECAVKLVSPLSEEEAVGAYTDEDEQASVGMELPDEATCRKYLLQGLGVLSDAERLAVVMRFCDRLTKTRIAELMNVSKEQVGALLTNAKAQFASMGILLGRILALIDAVEDKIEEEEADVGRKVDEAVLFPDEPGEEEDSFRKFSDLSEEEQTPEPKKEPEETAETLVLPRMPQAATQPIQKIEVPAPHDDDEDDDDEEESSHMSTIIIVLAVLIILFSGLFFAYQAKPEWFSWVPFLNAEEKVEENVDVSGQEPVEQPQSDVVDEQPQDVPAQETAPEATPIGTLTVNAQLLNMRTSASLDADIAGTVSTGDQLSVYEMTSDGTSDWYRVGEGQWVTGGDGSYVTYTPVQ